MSKYILLPLLLSVALIGGPVFAQTEDAAVPAVNAEMVTNADLGISNPGLLPTNPFYFLKEFGRNVRRVFTFDSVKKAELELNITNEKAAELKQVEENQPQNTEAIQSAIQNYQENQQRLVQKFENLAATSSNPNVEKLLQNFADRAVKHAKVFDELQNKFENQSQITGEINQVRETASNVVAAASANDDPAKFAAKVEQVLATEKGSELKNVRSVEILDNFIQNAPDKVKVSLEKVREDVSARLQIDIKNAIQTQGAETVKQAIMNLPGNAEHRTVILKELEQKAGTAVSGVLNSAVAAMNKEILSSENIMEKAQAQLQSASDALSKLASRLNENAQSSVDAKELYGRATNIYAKAKAAFEEKKYGEAFGQATSAEMMARNALRVLEEKIVPRADSLKIELDRLEMTLVKYADYFNSRNITAESNPKAYKLITSIKEFLSLARDAYAKNDSESVKNYIKQIKDYLNNLVQFIEGDVRTENKVPELKAVVPTLTKFIYKTSSFSGAYWQCYDGKESREENSTCKTSEQWQAAAKKFCDGHCYADNSKCGVNSWSVSNECGAENSSGGGSVAMPVPTTVSGGQVIPTIPSDRSCVQDSDCIIGIKATACCSCPQTINKNLVGIKGWELYEMGKDYSSKKTESCENIMCKTCATTNKSLCQNNLCQAYGGGSVTAPVPTVSSGASSGGSSSILPGSNVSDPALELAKSYCIKQGYEYGYRMDSFGAQYKACIFPSGEACDVWKFYKGKCIDSVGVCGAKPILPATPSNCKYDGPYCADGNWKYKLVCPESSSAVPTISGVSSASNPVPAAVPAVKATPVQTDSSGMGY